MEDNKKLNKNTKLKIAILGLCAGFLSGLFASGGGLIVVPRISLST